MNQVKGRQGKKEKEKKEEADSTKKRHKDPLLI
jgi:hypothetical protein